MTLFADAILIEHRYRIERSERRALLRATLGLLPAVKRMRPFARRVLPLVGTVVVHQPAAPAVPAAWEPSRAA